MHLKWILSESRIELVKIGIPQENSATREKQSGFTPTDVQESRA